jgi:putative transposase
MRRIFEKITEENDVKLIEFEGEVDHVHLLLNYPPKITIAKLVNSLKGVSSRLLRREYPHLETIYYNGALWSPSYFAASCGGAPLDIIKQYIQNQNTPKH